MQTISFSKIKLGFLFLLSSLIQNTFAQSMERSIGGSGGSAASSLGEQFGTTFDFSTGKATIQVPVAILGGRSLAVSYSLSYQTGGVKATDVSKEVGLGWNLVGGGSIVRQVRGLPDQILPLGSYPSRKIFHCPRELDIYGFYHSSETYAGDAIGTFRNMSANKMNNMDIYSLYENRDELISSINDWTSIGSQGWYNTPFGNIPNFSDWNEKANIAKWDAASDLFSYSCPAGSGSFTVNQFGEIINSTPNGLKIEFILPSTEAEADGGYWQITDLAGVRFSFGKSIINRGKSSFSTKLFKANNLGWNLVDSKAKEYFSDLPNSWQLETIESSTSNETIEFTYIKTTNSITTTSHFAEAFNQSAHYLDDAPFTELGFDNNQFWIEVNGQLGNCSTDDLDEISLKKLESTTKSDFFKISKVQLGDEARVRFTYKPLTNQYEPSDIVSQWDDFDQVNAIILERKRKGAFETIETTHLTYGFFHVGATPVKRAKLIQIEKENRAGEKRLVNRFEYFDPKDVSHVWGTVAYDHWGYFTIKNGYDPAQKVETGIGPKNFSSVNPFENRQSENVGFEPFTTGPASNFYAAQKNTDFLSTLGYSIKQIYARGGARLEFEYERNSSMGYNYSDYPYNMTKKWVGGLRIKAITSQIESASKKVNVRYGDYSDVDNLNPSGRLYSDVLSYGNEAFIATRKGFSIVCNDLDWTLYYDYSLQIMDKPVNQLFDAQGNHVRYSKVCIFEENGELGRSEVHFNSYPELFQQPIYQGSIRNAVLAQSGIIPHRRLVGKFDPANWWKSNNDWGHFLGTPKKSEVFRADGSLLARVENTYSIEEWGAVNFNYEVKDLVIDGVQSNYPEQVMRQYFSENKMSCRFTRLAETKTFNFNPDESHSEIKTTFINRTDFPWLVRRKETQTSLGERVAFEESRLALDFLTPNPSGTQGFPDGTSSLCKTIKISLKRNGGFDPIESTSGYSTPEGEFITGYSFAFKRLILRNPENNSISLEAILAPEVAGNPDYDFNLHIPHLSETYQLKHNRPIPRTGSEAFLPLKFIGEIGEFAFDSRVKKVADVLRYDRYFNPVLIKDYYGRKSGFKFYRHGTNPIGGTLPDGLGSVGVLNFEGKEENPQSPDFYFPEVVGLTNGNGIAFSPDAFTGNGSILLKFGESPILELVQGGETGKPVKAVDVSVWVKSKNSSGSGKVVVKFIPNSGAERVKIIPFSATNSWKVVSGSFEGFEGEPLPASFIIKAYVENDRQNESQPESDLIIDDLLVAKKGMGYSLIGFDIFNQKTSVTDINHRVVRQEFNIWGEPTISRDQNGDILSITRTHVKPD